MLELKFAIYYRAASLPSQASYAVLAEEPQAFFKHCRTPTVFQIQQSCVIIIFVAKWFVRMRTREEKWRRKGSHIVLQCGSNRLAWLQTWKKVMGWCTAQWKMLLFCAKTIVKESRKFELARLKKKEKHFWFGTFALLFSATGCVVRHENPRRGTVGCYNGL